MAKKQTSAPAEATNETRDYSQRRWMKPTKRAKGYASERKAAVHQRGAKNGEPLSEYEKGIRSGYLLAQSDSAGIYKYKKALNDGKTKDESIAISRQKGKKKN